MSQFYKVILFPLIFLLFLAGCRAPLVSSSPTQTDGPLPTATQTTVPATALPTPSPTLEPPPTATPNPVVRFAVIGDYGTAGPGLAAVAEMIAAWDVDFIITTGDNNYPIGSPETIDENIGQYFHQYIYPYNGDYGNGADQNRFFPTLGNHDWLWTSAQPYLDYFELPGNERYYDFQWDFIHFFALDSDTAEPDGIGQNSPQAAWLEEKLSASTATWQIVYFHHSPYSSGYNGPITYMRWPFETWGADLILSGHDHDYERLMVNDLTYIVDGLGGGQLYPLGETAPESLVRFAGQYGALLVEATPTQIKITFTTIEGEVIDEYTLTQP
ncbi:metallophosphoesterase [bacterium]|nr:metallophosphoesterase [bacterium]